MTPDLETRKNPEWLNPGLKQKEELNIEIAGNRSQGVIPYTGTTDRREAAAILRESGKWHEIEAHFGLFPGSMGGTCTGFCRSEQSHFLAVWGLENLDLDDARNNLLILWLPDGEPLLDKLYYHLHLLVGAASNEAVADIISQKGEMA